MCPQVKALLPGIVKSLALRPRACRLTISHTPKRSCGSWRARPGPVAGRYRSRGRRSSGERRVVVTGPLADDRDRHARVLHERQGRVARVVQGDPPQPGPPQQAAELVGIPLGMNGSASLVGDHVLAPLVPLQLSES